MTITSNDWTQRSTPEDSQEMDQALVAAAQGGSDVAFEALHTLHARAVYRVTLSITKNTSDAEDATQETFLRAYRGLKSFRQESQFLSWLTRIAINSSLMLLRRRRSHREWFVECHSEPDRNILIDCADSRPNPELFLHLKQIVERVEKSVELLPKHLRLVAELGVLQEQSIQEISNALKISNSATKSRLYRARKRMASRSSQHRLAQQSAQRDSPVECLL